MRILLVHAPYRQEGGEERMVATQEQVLRARGHDVVRGGVSAIAQTRPDVVHVHNQFPHLLPKVYGAAAKAGVLVVQHVHNARITCVQPFLVRDGAACHDCVGRAPLPGIVHRCYRGSLVQSVAATAVQLTHRRAWQRAARYVAVSDAVADTLRASNAVAADRVRVCHNGLDADPGARPPRADEGYALYVGRLSYEKGVDLLLDAAAQVPGTRFVIVGDGPERDSLARRAPANVAFRGHLDRAGVLAVMRGARALIAPSRGEEPFGLGVIEAAALGVPAIVTRVGGMPEIVRDGETGLVVAPYDAAAIATAVAALDAPRAQTLGGAARREYERRFTPDAFADRLLAIYDEVLGR